MELTTLLTGILAACYLARLILHRGRMMMIFERIEPDGFEQIVYCQDKSAGLRAIIALHSTVLGPATGGARMWNYSNESEAFTDVLRLSQGMTHKASISGLKWGGGKAVLIGDPSAPRP